MCYVLASGPRYYRLACRANHQGRRPSPQGRLDASEPDTPDEQPGPLLVGQRPTVQAGAHVFDKQAVVVGDCQGRRYVQGGDDVLPAVPPDTFDGR